MKAPLLAGFAALAVLATPASAEDMQGKVQVKLLGTAVLPDGKITDVNVDIVGLPAGTQTKANDNVVPTVAIEYFVADNFSIETICCFTQHDVDTTAGFPAGTELVSNARVIPATFTAKYHVDGGAIRPYVGAGVTYFLWVKDRPGAATIPLGVTETDFSDEFGFVLQAGVDIPVSDNGFGISLDAKRYFVDTTSRWYVGDVVAIETVHKLDPWVLSAGVTFAF
ncbi:MAG: OmpW family protein [Alphaproteobacteria bacterium]|nr:MAG: OmpW family protein [Alphaproteobacteria bacterium]